MLRRTLIVACAVAAAVAADVGAAPAAPDGTIRGRVVNETTNRPQAGVEVTLTAADRAGGDRSELTDVTDARGRFAFTGLATGPNRIYAVDGLFDGGRFAGGALSLPADTDEPPAVDVTLRVWATSTDPAAIVVRRDALFAVPGQDGRLGIVESVVVVNTADRAYIGRRGGGGTPQTLGFGLPRAAGRPVQVIDATLDIPSVVPAGFGFAATTAIPPGEHRITFTYPVEGSGGSFDLTRPALYPTIDLVVFAAEPLTVDGNRFAPAGRATIEGRTYSRYDAVGELDAGDPIQLLVVAEADPPVGAAAVAVAGIALVGAGAWWIARMRRRARAARGLGHDEVVAEIAALDLRHDAGEIGDDEWAERRAGLKSLLTRDPGP